MTEPALLFPKPGSGEDPAYLAWIRTLPCLICGGAKGKSDPHHQNRKGHGKMAGTCEDRRAVPLCRSDHDDYEQMGRERFWAGVDIEDVIQRLNRIYEEVRGA